MVRYPKSWLIFMIIFQVFVSIAGGTGAAYYYYNYHKRICPGIEVSGIPLGGLDVIEAKEKLQNGLPRPSRIILRWGESDYPLVLDGNVCEFLLDEVLQDAVSMLNIGRGWSFFNIIRWVPASQSLEVPLTISSSYLREKLDALREDVDREPENARLVIENGIPLCLEEKTGAVINSWQSRKAVEKYLRRGELEGIPLQVDVILPQITRNDLPDFSQCLAAYGTPLDPEEENRNHNIKLAAAAIEGLILEPGEIFSFYKNVGPVTKDRGFLEAKVIQNRKLVPGIGGGICQLATTLYQVALRAELEIIERSRHSRPVYYVPLGQDAAVASGLLDLKIRNNRDFPIIFVGQTNGTLRFSVYGAEKDLCRNVEIVSEGVEVLQPQLLELPDPNLPKGVRQQVQKEEEGYKVKVYRLIYEDGVEIDRELISTDVYQPVNQIVRIGMMGVPEGKK